MNAYFSLQMSIPAGNPWFEVHPWQSDLEEESKSMPSDPVLC